jgi:hypothetical protein
MSDLSDLEHMVVEDMLEMGVELSFEPYEFEKGIRRKLIAEWWESRLDDRP